MATGEGSGDDLGRIRLERARADKLVNEALSLEQVEILEGSSENGKGKIRMVGLACYTSSGLVYVSFGQGNTREQRVETLGRKIGSLDDTGIDESAHRLIMQKAKMFGVSGHEVLAGLTLTDQPANKYLTALHFPRELTFKEASRVIKQAFFSKSR